jgi:hypothetical protein
MAPRPEGHRHHSGTEQTMPLPGKSNPANGWHANKLHVDTASCGSPPKPPNCIKCNLASFKQDTVRKLLRGDTVKRPTPRVRDQRPESLSASRELPKPQKLEKSNGQTGHVCTNKTRHPRGGSHPHPEKYPAGVTTNKIKDAPSRYARPA